MYLDNVIKIFKLIDAYLKDVDVVPSRLREAGFLHNLKKCCCFLDGVTYLGRITKPGAQTIDH